MKMDYDILLKNYFHLEKNFVNLGIENKHLNQRNENLILELKLNKEELLKIANDKKNKTKIVNDFIINLEFINDFNEKLLKRKLKKYEESIDKLTDEYSELHYLYNRLLDDVKNDKSRSKSYYSDNKQI
ncbi:uncharacterized protein OCT59_025769 [Rhizophagus irregularis]|nr:hypothetical protein OCT59_025769 [Rhizophagus irregularis]GBC11054.2 hypothetical protein RIR_jg33937.t1 [Rhizophagus irregularis DAOM 181602=DAOM 197198]